MSVKKIAGFTVTVCSVCGGTTFRRFDYLHDLPTDTWATEFAECLNCHELYLYKVPVQKEGGDA